MRALPAALTLALFAGAAVAAAQTPNSAAAILASAETSAAGQHKSIFLIFHASW